MDNMHEDQGNPDIEKYLKDIDTIKDLLFEVEKKTFYESWAFYFWGGLVIIGSIIHFFIEKYFHLTVDQLFFKIWLPIILITGFIELITIIRSITKHSLSLFSRSFVKTYLSLTGHCAVLCFVIILFIELNAIQLLPIVLLLSCSAFYFVLAQQTAYTGLYIHGFLMILLAIILYLFNIQHQILTLIIGFVVGSSLFIAGITARNKIIKINKARKTKK